jgi:hypothetical protein
MTAAAPEGNSLASGHGDDHLPAGEAGIQDAVGLDDLIEAEDLGGLGRVDARFRAGWHQPIRTVPRPATRRPPPQARRPGGPPGGDQPGDQRAAISPVTNGRRSAR